VRFRSTLTKGDERGVVSAFVAVAAVVLLLVVGVAVDYGRAIATQRLLADEAEQAARAGAGQVSAQGLRSGHLELDTPAAIQAGEHFTVISGTPGTVSVQDGVVIVRITEKVPTTILSAFGVSEITVSATASAVDVKGDTRQH
jgi:uncharacterized membrane protein